MNVVTQDINANVSQENNIQFICAMQGDNDTMKINVHIYDRNEPYTLPSGQGIEYVLEGTAGHGIGICNTKDVKLVDSNTISFPLSKNLLSRNGQLTLSIVVIDSTDANNPKRLSTFPFYIKVVNAPLDKSSMDTSGMTSEFNILDDLIKRGEVFLVRIENDINQFEQIDKPIIDADIQRMDEIIESWDNSSTGYKKQIEDFLKNGGSSSGSGGSTGSGSNGNIAYYETFADFKKDYDANNINAETLVVIKEDNSIIYTLNTTLGNNMSLASSSGALTQTVNNGIINNIVVNADSGYYFPINYSPLVPSGIDVIRDSYTQITIVGVLTSDTDITLDDTVAKTTPSAPSGLTGGIQAINGTTSAMEYASSSTASSWTTCGSGSTSVSAGTWYVRYKATDTSYVSPCTSVVAKDVVPVPSAVTNLSVSSKTSNSVTLTFTAPSSYDHIKVFCSTSSSVSNSNYNYSSSNLTSSSYTFSNLTTGTKYYFVAYAYNVYGDSSSASNIVSGTPELQKVYLYKEGDECTSITGGWQLEGYNNGTLVDGYAPHCSKKSTYLACDLSSSDSMGTEIFKTVNNASFLINNKARNIYVEYSLSTDDDLSGGDRVNLNMSNGRIVSFRETGTNKVASFTSQIREDTTDFVDFLNSLNSVESLKLKINMHLDKYVHFKVHNIYYVM